MSNAALARTSVASTTVLSSTSGLFTLFIGVLLGQDSLNMAKVVAVFVSMAGVIMTALGKTWASDESEMSTSRYLFSSSPSCRPFLRPGLPILCRMSIYCNGCILLIANEGTNPLEL